MDSCDDTLAGGFPHSDIHGSTPARGSPWLFAACHVLHRLLVPRHPPNALLMLEISTMHRNHPQIRMPAHGRIICSAHNRFIAPARADTMNFHASERFAPPQGRPKTPGQTLRRQRPETHQNLIYPDKEQRPRGDANGTRKRGFFSVHTYSTDDDRFSAIQMPNPPSPLVETIGFEPTTPCLQSRCSPS